MNKKIINSIFLSFLIIVCLYGSVSAETLAPDRSAQVLDLLALECQKITDFSYMAQNGDLSQYENIKRHVSVTINNITILMNGYDNDSINNLWNMFGQFNPDAESARRTAEYC